MGGDDKVAWYENLRPLPTAQPSSQPSSQPSQPSSHPTAIPSAQPSSTAAPTSAADIFPEYGSVGFGLGVGVIFGCCTAYCLIKLFSDGKKKQKVGIEVEEQLKSINT